MFDETPDDSDARLRAAYRHARNLRIQLSAATFGIYDDELVLRGQLEELAHQAEEIGRRAEHLRRQWKRERSRRRV